jgi:hypothetical protein
VKLDENWREVFQILVEQIIYLLANIPSNVFSWSESNRIRMEKHQENRIHSVNRFCMRS